MGLLDKLIANFHPAGALRRGIQLQEQGDQRRVRCCSRSPPAPAFRKPSSAWADATWKAPAFRPAEPTACAGWNAPLSKGYVEAQALLATLCLHGMAPGFADAGPNAGAGLFGGQTTGGAGLSRALPSGPGGLPRLDRPTARRCSALSSPPVPKTLRNIEEGDRWYQKSAAGGCPQGQLGYALVLARDTSRPGAQEELLRHLSQAAEKGLATALFLYGMVLERGAGRAPGPRRRRRMLQARRGEGPSRRAGPLGPCSDGGSRRRAQPAGRRIVAAARRPGRRSGSRRAGGRHLRQRRHAAAELRRGGDVVPPRRGCQPPRRRACTWNAPSHRRRRSARSGRSCSAVQHRRTGRRCQRPCRSRQPAAARSRRRTGSDPHPRVVRAGRQLRAT